MNTLIAPLIAWIVGGLVAWLAGRYHLTVDQQQLVSADVLGGIGFVMAGATGLTLHWRARMAPPPNGGTHASV